MTTYVGPRHYSNRPHFLDALDQLPESLRAQAESHLPGSQVVEYIFVVPPESYRRGYRFRMLPRRVLIFTPRGLLYLAESTKPGIPGDSRWMNVEDILLIKLSLILIYGRLEIWGCQSGQVAKIDLEYNTVIQPRFTPVLQKLIRKTWPKETPASASMTGDPDFRNFVNTSYSFYNGLKVIALQPDEQVLGHLYQPEISEPRLRYLKKKIHPKTVFALTDKQIVLLQEDLAFRKHYEWIFTFCPLQRVAAMEETASGDWQKLSIRLAPAAANMQIDLLLTAENARKCVDLWQVQRPAAEMVR